MEHGIKIKVATYANLIIPKMFKCLIYELPNQIGKNKINLIHDSLMKDGLGKCAFLKRRNHFFNF